MNEINLIDVCCILTWYSLNYTTIKHKDEIKVYLNYLSYNGTYIFLLE